MNVLYEDNHIIVVNKQSGEIVQGDKTGDVPLSDILKAYLKEKYNKPGNVYLGVVHRLDRPVTGAVLFAKTSKALPRLNKLFAEHEKVKKTYWAIVPNQPSVSENEHQPSALSPQPSTSVSAMAWASVRLPSRRNTTTSIWKASGSSVETQT